MRRFSIAVMVIALSAMACEGPAPAKIERSEEGRAASGISAPAAPPGALPPSGLRETAVTDKAAPNLPAATQRDPDVAPTMIIRTGQASIEVDSIEIAIAQLRQLVQRVGGYIGNTSLQTGSEQVRSATIELKIPAARFDEVREGLTPIGKVEYVNVTAEDVGEEFVDVTARVANAKRLEERLIDLLATRTGKLQDVLALERELARVREEIERYEGRLRYLKSRTSISTLSVTVHEPAPIIGDNPGSNVIGDAFRQAWRNFVQLLAGVIASLGVLVPIAALAIAAWFGVRKLRRARAVKS